MSAAPRNASRLFTVVVASLCNDARSDLLKRACDSVRAMAGDMDYSLIVVANGPGVSPSVLSWLTSRADVRVIRLRSGSHPLARRIGAEMAESEFIAFLDDDDELIANTLATKIAHFREHPDHDVLVTDGLRISESAETKIFPAPESRSADFVETLMRAGWGAGALTLRAQKIDLAVFDPLLRHMEWTLTTLELANRHKFGYLDAPMYRYYETTPNSLSKAAAHNLAAPDVWRRLSRTYAGTRHEDAVRRRYGNMCHNASQECSNQGRMSEAWHLHFESMRAPGGLTYMPFGLKLAVAWLRRHI